jgi:ATP phosphoribosyltransferase regulatory subunit
MVSALDLAPAWKRRLIKDFNRKASLTQDLDRLTLAAPNGKPDYQGVLAALAGSDPKAARALVADLLSIAGISAVGGRSVGEIADRFLEQSTLGASAALPPYTRSLVERFLAVSGNPMDASVEMRKLASDGGLVLTPMLDLFDARNVELAKRGIDLKQVAFSSAFGRGMDYYTGFVFELTDGTSSEPLVAGGRYDDLLTRLGSASPIPAVGFSVWIERLAGAAS